MRTLPEPSFLRLIEWRAFKVLPFQGGLGELFFIVICVAVSDSESGDFFPGKEIEELRGGVLLYAAQGILQSYATRADKSPFRMETI